MKTRSLRARLLLWSGAATSLTLVLVVILVDHSFRANIRSHLEDELTFAARVAEDTRSRQMEARISQTVTLAMDTRLRAAVETGDRETIVQTLMDVTRIDPALWSAVVSPDGLVLAATSQAPVARLREARTLIDEAREYDTADLWREGDELIQVAASAILFGADPLAILVTGHPLDTETMSALETAVGRPAAALVRKARRGPRWEGTRARTACAGTLRAGSRATPRAHAGWFGRIRGHDLGRTALPYRLAPTSVP